jgi:RNA ligase (TIGR02306 family)
MASNVVVPVATIESIAPHPGADRLEIAKVLGWQVVVPKGRHQPGEKVVYFPPDAVLPAELAERFGVSQYLSKGRVRCARLRGVPSYGFAMPPDDPGWAAGTDLAAHYGITKYLPPLRPSAGDAEVDHPLFQRYTDIENLRNYPDAFEPGEMVVLTEKIHGTSCRVGIVEGELMAGSMGMRRKRPPDAELHRSTYWFPLTLEPVAALLAELGRGRRQVILYGEVFGAGIQSFHYGMKGRLAFAAFDLLVDGRYLDWPDLQRTLARLDLPAVPVLYEGPLTPEVVRQHSLGKTTLADHHVREGVVVRPLRERTDPRLGRLVLKYLSDAYLLDDKRSDFTEQ